MKTEKNFVIKWLGLLVVVALSVATMYSLNAKDRFDVVVEQLLIDSDFSDASKYWDYVDSSVISFKDGQLIFQDEAMSNSKVVQTVSGVDIDNPGYVKLTLDASSENIRAEERAGAGGGVLLVSRDGEGEILNGSRVLLLNGSNEIDTYSQVEILEEQPVSIEVIFRLNQASGVFSVGSPVLSLLQENKSYKVIKAIFMCAWVAVALFLVKVALTALSGRQSIVLFLLFGVALTGVLLPESIMQGVTEKIASTVPVHLQDRILQQLALVYPANSLSAPGAMVSKIGHVFIFFAIGLFAGLSRSKFGFYFVVACILVFALMTEAVQMFVFGRTTSIADFLLDSGAGVIGVLLGAGLTLFGKKVSV